MIDYLNYDILIFQSLRWPFYFNGIKRPLLITISSMRKIIFIAALLFIFTLEFSSHALSALAGSPGKNTEDIAIFWTDGQDLKALNIVRINRNKIRVGIISIPTCTLINSGEEYGTIKDIYKRRGIPGVLEKIETVSEVYVGKYVEIPQQSLRKISSCIGKIEISGKKTTLLDVFDKKYTDKPVDLQVEIRSLAAAVVKPKVMIHLPELILIMATEFETNASLADFFTICNYIEKGGPEIIKKKLLPGSYCQYGSQTAWQASSHSWKTALSEICK
ncbi:MAG: hypothetical protein ACOY46_07315 [Bacillota bacterium]